MKNSIIFSIAFFIVLFSSLSAVSQTNSDQEVLKLSKDIKGLEQANYKLKKEVAINIDSLNKSIKEIKLLHQESDNKLNSANNLLSETSGKISKVQKKTNERFLRFRGIIKTSIILGAIALAILGIMFVFLFIRLKSGFIKAKKELALTEESLNNMKVQMNEQNQNLIKTINEINHSLVQQISDSKAILVDEINKEKKATVQLTSDMKDQIEKEILLAKQSATDQINDLKKETVKQLNEQIANLNQNSEKSLISLKEQLGSEIKTVNQTSSDHINSLKKESSALLEERLNAISSIFNEALAKIRKETENANTHINNQLKTTNDSIVALKYSTENQITNLEKNINTKNPKK